MTNSSDNMWRMRFRQAPGGWEGPLLACWEVEGDPISDNFLPEETGAEDLLRIWADAVQENHKDNLIPIYWFVESLEAAKFEAFPFAPPHFVEKLDEDFLTFYTWPEHARTGERLNWLTLPVVDKLWRPGRADKGGFIQEATGWKPAILQPHVYLPALLSVFQV